MNSELLAIIDIEAKKREKDALLTKIQTPEILTDYRKAAELNAELQQLDELIDSYTNYVTKSEQLDANQELLQDPEMAELAEAEISFLSKELTTLEQKLRDLTALKLDDDDKNAIFEIRAGTGGAEASLFADEIQRMYIRYLNEQKFTVEHIHTSFEETGGIKESIFRVAGKGVFGKLRFESGVHRVQRVPVTEANGRIHTSAISVVVLPELSENEVSIPESDYRMDVYRSSGAGGQGVNRTDSAVRITHIPTGIVVTCQDGRSQHKNKEKALSILASKLYALQQAEKAQQTKDIRSQAIQSGDRSAKIRTFNFPQGRVTDHRIKQSWFNLSEILEGDIDEIVTTVNRVIRQTISDGKSLADIADDSDE